VFVGEPSLLIKIVSSYFILFYFQGD